MSMISELDATPTYDLAPNAQMQDHPTSAVALATDSHPRPVLHFSILDSDRPEFDELPSVEERTRIHTWLALFRELRAGGNVERGCKAIAARHGWVGREKGEPGFSWRTIQNRYYLYVNGGTKNGALYNPCDWRVLRDTRRVPAPRDAGETPFKFRQFWKALRSRYQRNGGDKAAHRALIRLWHEHRAEIPLEIGSKQIAAGDEIPFIPGYPIGWPEADTYTEIPAGWSYSNLNRIETDDYTTSVLKLGPSHVRSAGMRPKLSMTREGLKYAQLYYFDDQQYDEHVNYLGVARKAMRPWGLDCLEGLSACHVANLLKPTLVDDISQVKRRLSEVDSAWVIMDVLMNEGYRSDTGTTIAGEHGTAALRARYAEALARITGGKVEFDAGGVEGAPAFAGMFEGKGGGNFRHKAPLESIRNLLRNEMCALPGSTGKDWDHSPDHNVPDKGGLFKYNTSILKAAEALPEEQRKRLKYPFLDWHHFCQLALYFINVMDRRTDHDLKHWHRCGFVVECWRLPSDPSDPSAMSPWQPMEALLSLPAEQQSIIRALLKANPALTAVKKLSPWSVRQQLRRDPAIRKLSPATLPEIFGLESAFTYEVIVKDECTITIKDREVDPEPMDFFACVPSRFGGEEWLPRGSEFFAFLDHIRGLLYLFDKRASRRGAYIGCCHMRDDAPLANRDALAKACGAIAKIEKEFLAPAVRLGGDVARRNLEMRQHNAELLAEDQTGLTTAERKQIERNNARADEVNVTEQILSRPDSETVSRSTPENNDW